MPMMSFAENREDVLLRRLFPEPADGFFIDVGANEPVFNSVTKHFSVRGWRGINVEPGAVEFAKLCADRPRDLNLNVGLSDREGTLTFHEAPDRTGWSTFSDDRASGFGLVNVRSVRREVPITTLAKVCEAHAPSTIDFLKIDVEGLEASVIAGGDWQRWRPRAVVVEANDPETWEPTLLAADYRFATFDGLNRYYLRAEDADLLPRLAVPVNVLDDFIIYGYHHRIMELYEQVQAFEGMGPTSRSILAMARGTARRHPRLASAARRVARRILARRAG